MLEREYGGASLHESFDNAMDLIQTRGELAKEFSGLEEIDAQDSKNEVFIHSISGRILKAPIAASGLNQNEVLETRLTGCEWSNEGLRFTWSLTSELPSFVTPDGTDEEASFLLEHVVRLDRRDVLQHALHRAFAEKYYELKVSFTRSCL